MNLGITGSRDGPTLEQGKALCTALWYYRKWYTVLHHGDCTGVDAYAAEYWARCQGSLWAHPPVSTKYRAFVQSGITERPAAYLQRNMAIVLHADLILACPKEPAEVLRSGTWATIRYAKDAGKPLFIIHTNGSIEGHKPQ